MKLTSLCLAATLAFSGAAFAQTAPAPDPNAPAMPPADQATPPADQMDNMNKDNKALEPGANSFTEAQARSWLEDAGYTDVGTLVQSDDGIWRGEAKRDGATVAVAVDYKGTISTE